MNDLVELGAILPVEPIGSVTIAVRLAVAVVMGVIIGWERSKSEKPADARTMALVAAGAAGFTLVGVQIAAASSMNPSPGLNPDPTRIIAYVVSGVGFLGAGAIIHSKKSVRGLTTAASIWTAAAIGASCGIGEFAIAIALFVVAIVMLWVPWFIPYNSNGDTHVGGGLVNSEPSAETEQESRSLPPEAG